MPFSRIAKASSGMRTASVVISGTSVSVASITSPRITTLETVPSPGRCRSGIHSSRISTPETIVTVPIDRPVWREMPWLRTLHGSRPSPARNCRPMLRPYRTSPV
ncbi:hypothetical protein OEIGOIKO_00395 [Streptomyces chrestomyceticus JCM 4735]|uniref:Uncharacterized protein n=1 Tax=Streptomyces chrestomyceticus JCM 4735 TaxID=1306181 RepID=A0A7U9PV12_9ACTN|nr:hypothetical protein OEIGOIKO_00395 [Streptomyces chrestomyceticus JCM 4735]